MSLSVSRIRKLTRNQPPNTVSWSEEIWQLNLRNTETLMSIIHISLLDPNSCFFLSIEASVKMNYFFKDLRSSWGVRQSCHYHDFIPAKGIIRWSESQSKVDCMITKIKHWKIVDFLLCCRWLIQWAAQRNKVNGRCFVFCVRCCRESGSCNVGKKSCF